MTIIRNSTIRNAAVGLLLAGAMAPAYAAQPERLASTNQGAVAKAPGNGAAAPRTEQDTSRRVCVRMQLSGSRISREVCRTQAEWDRMGGLPE